MKRFCIAITPEHEVEGEARAIAGILDAGFAYVHLRHPGASLRDIKRIIEDLPPHLHSRLRLHGHFELTNEFNLGGLHLNRRCPVPPPLYKGAVSRSCHSVAEVRRALAEGCDYVTLSPIFPSISKPGYAAVFDHDELHALPEGRVVALGGLTPERLGALERYPFGGYAFLGCLWNSANPAATAKTIMSSL